MRASLLVRCATRLGAGAFLGAAAVTGGIAFLNDGLTVGDLAAIQADLFLVFAIVLAASVAVMIGAKSIAIRRFAAADVDACVAIVLFSLWWFARLEPAHQLVSVRPHVSGWGAAELFSIAALSLVLVRVWTRVTGPAWRRAGARAMAIVMASASLAALAFALEPSRDRSDAIADLAGALPDATPPAARSGRVLVIGVDGLDWRTAAWMIRHDRMPTLRRLLASGRYYQHENRAMSASSEIWSAVYTGQPARSNGVHDLARWSFAGASHPIAVLPRFGMHGWFFVDELLKHVTLPLWTDIPASTMNLVAPPVWSIASAAGKRVGVFEPVPYVAVPEATNGFYAVHDNSRYQIVRRDRFSGAIDETTEPIPAGAGERDDFPGETASVEQVVHLFSAERLDLGIYYSHFLDTVQHRFWDYRLHGGLFGGDPQALDESFDVTPISRAYEAADAGMARLIAGFGEPLTVVVVSDHGWTYDDYEHAASPRGVLVISPAEGSQGAGYSGVADVLGIAPTVLSLIGLPADRTMTAPVAPFAVSRTASVHAATVDRVFLPRRVQDADQLRLLRSLGY